MDKMKKSGIIKRIGPDFLRFFNQFFIEREYFVFFYFGISEEKRIDYIDLFYRSRPNYFSIVRVSK